MQQFCYNFQEIKHLKASIR